MIPNSKLILGPPGCGKTYRLIQEIKGALDAGTHPSRIGVISFTRKAIEEMVTRSCAEFSLQPTDFPYMRTSHSFGFNGLGLQSQDVMQVSDYQEIGAIVGLDFEGKDRTSVDDGITLPTLGGSGAQYLQMITRARYRMISLDREFNEAGDRTLFFPKLEQVSAQIEEYKQTMSKYDFVDMIDKYIEIGEPPHLDYLFIDEAQDFTPLQWEMAKKLADFSQKTFIAGDDDQAVHRWTGVNVDLFINASDDVEVLKQSYRIPESIHRLSQHIVQRIDSRVEKEFFPREEMGTVEYVWNMDDIPFGEGSWTVMARTNSYVKEMAKWFYKTGFKFSTKGRSSISDKLVENIMAWEDLCQDKKLGVERVKKLYSGLPKQGDDAVVQRGATKRLDTLAPEDELDMATLMSDYGLLRGADSAAYDVLKVSSSMRLYIEAIHRRGDDLLSPPRINISTFHAMKGGEDDNCVVYTASTKACVESKYPEDEHRAFYVGITRARHSLYILQSNKDYRYTI